jgi:hypothetical protein
MPTKLFSSLSPSPSLYSKFNFCMSRFQIKFQNSFEIENKKKPKPSLPRPQPPGPFPLPHPAACFSSFSPGPSLPPGPAHLLAQYPFAPPRCRLRLSSSPSTHMAWVEAVVLLPQPPRPPRLTCPPSYTLESANPSPPLIPSSRRQCPLSLFLLRH